MKAPFKSTEQNLKVVSSANDWVNVVFGNKQAPKKRLHKQLCSLEKKVMLIMDNDGKHQQTMVDLLPYLPQKWYTGCCIQAMQVKLMH